SSPPASAASRQARRPRATRTSSAIRRDRRLLLIVLPISKPASAWNDGACVRARIVRLGFDSRVNPDSVINFYWSESAEIVQQFSA
ncbi:hypothetical protein ACVBGC_02355, partial [Burkholderia stagnalis]